VAEFFAKGESGGEALAGEFGFAKAQVGEAAEVETVGLAPGVLAVGFDGEIEGFAGGLKSFLKVAGSEVYRPTLLNGQPVEVITDVIVNYTLSQ
jgi:hypothetical protein